MTNTTIATLLSQLKSDHPDFHYEPHEFSYWSPSDRTVYFNDSGTQQNMWTLLHETAHACCEHFDFRSDFHLIKLESEAWQKTLELCKQYTLPAPSDDYIEDCIDTYRNWQYRRSLCTSCSKGGIQIKPDTYYCIDCRGEWKVTKQRFCRAYRKKQPQLNEAVSQA